MTGPAVTRAFFTCVIHVSNSAFQRVTALQEAWDQHCRKVSPITLVLQYRFATPNSLKPRPGLEGCKIAPLCNLVRVEIPPRCSSPLSLINSESPGSARSRPGRGARRSRSLDGEDRAVQSRAPGKGG